MRKIFTIAILAFSVNAYSQTICTNDTFVSIAPIPSVLHDMRAVYYNNDFYIFGGFNSINSTSVVNTTYKYNISSNTWLTLTNMLTGRSEMGVAEVNGIVYCIGGWTGSVSNKNEAYNISTNTWQTMVDLPTPITCAYAVSLNNKVYVFGGTLGNTTTYFYAYDPSNNTYATLTTPTQNRSMIRLVVYNNKIYAIGGSYYYNGTHDVLDNLDEYDPIANTWTPKASLPTPLKSVGATIYDNKIYVFGGSLNVYNTSVTNTLYIYDFASNTWLPGSTMPFSRTTMDVKTVNDSVYLFGGYTGTAATDACSKYYCLDLVCQYTDTTFISVTDTLIINANLTGINPPNNINTIKVFPNPTNDHITIDNGTYANMNGYQIKIMNSLSQIVFQSVINQQQFYIDLSTWTGNGIYFVHLIDAQSNTIDIRKIVLQ